MSDIKIRNWKRFQHYKNRNPPWIKLYRELLDNKEWRVLDDFSARFLIELWMLAAENEGQVSDDINALAWRLRYDSKQLAKIPKALKTLSKNGFLHGDSELLADCKRDASAETEKKRDKKEKEKTDPVLSVSIPESLKGNDAFAKAWLAWIAYRKEKKKGLTSSTAEAQLKKLAEKPLAALAVINQSIEKGWVGLFDLKDNATGSQGETDPGILDYARQYKEYKKNQAWFESQDAVDFWRKVWDNYGRDGKSRVVAAARE